jgi:hypothetical protein
MRILYLHSQEPLTLFAESCFTLTPKVFLCGPHDLYLEIETTSKHFTNEETFLKRFELLAETFQIHSKQRVLTDRPEWAKALLVSSEHDLAKGESLERLKLLSVDRLAHLGNPFTLEEEAPMRNRLIGFLKKVGIYSIGDFIALPIETVHHRFGKVGEALHDWACGKKTLCLPLFQSEEPFYEKIDADDLYSLDSLLFRLRQALIRMELRLHARSLATKNISLTFHLESHPKIAKTLLLTEPLYEAQAILRVLREFLAGFQWESPLTQLEVTLNETVPHLPGQLSLLDSSENLFYDLALYVDRLRNRLGAENVGVPALNSSHLPEKSYYFAWPPRSLPPPREGFPPRPLFLFTPPKPFHPTREWKLQLSEKLKVEWWDPGGNRDYFTAQRGQELLWVYHDLTQGAWFIHGTFD